MRLLFIGDVVGRCGREAVDKILPNLISDNAVDFVVLNGENAAGGFGITEDIHNGFINAKGSKQAPGNGNTHTYSHTWPSRSSSKGVRYQTGIRSTGSQPL